MAKDKVVVLVEKDIEELSVEELREQLRDARRSTRTVGRILLVVWIACLAYLWREELASALTKVGD